MTTIDGTVLADAREALLGRQAAGGRWAGGSGTGLHRLGRRGCAASRVLRMLTSAVGIAALAGRRRD